MHAVRQLHLIDSQAAEVLLSYKRRLPFGTCAGVVVALLVPCKAACKAEILPPSSVSLFRSLAVDSQPQRDSQTSQPSLLRVELRRVRRLAD